MILLDQIAVRTALSLFGHFKIFPDNESIFQFIFEHTTKINTNNLFVVVILDILNCLNDWLTTISVYLQAASQAKNRYMYQLFR